MAEDFPQPDVLKLDAAVSGPATGPLRMVYSSYSPVEAHIVSGMLEDSGIECFLGNEFIAAVESPISNATGGVQVLVRASDVDRANELLREASLSDAALPAS